MKHIRMGHRDTCPSVLPSLAEISQAGLKTRLIWEIHGSSVVLNIEEYDEIKEYLDVRKTIKRN